MKKLLSLVLLIVAVSTFNLIAEAESNWGSDSLEGQEEQEAPSYFMQDALDGVFIHENDDYYVLLFDINKIGDVSSCFFSLEDGFLVLQFVDHEEEHIKKNSVELSNFNDDVFVCRAKLPVNIALDKMSVEYKDNIWGFAFPKVIASEKDIKLADDSSTGLDNEPLRLTVNLEGSEGQGLIFVVDDNKSENVKDIKIVDTALKNELVSFKTPVFDDKVTDYKVDTERDGDDICFIFTK